MLVTEKGQVTIPKHIRMAAGVAPGGSAGVLVDTNVCVDCFDAASAWHNWALGWLQR